MADPVKLFRISFKCDHCDVVHQAIGDLSMVMNVAANLLEDGILAVLIRDEVKAKTDELDYAEDVLSDPLVAKYAEKVFKRL